MLPDKQDCAVLDKEAETNSILDQIDYRITC